jgi:hypothetical protein
MTLSPAARSRTFSFVELKERADSGLVQKSGERTTFLPKKRADKVARKALAELCPLAFVRELELS